jgi:hypothetical protein
LLTDSFGFFDGFGYAAIAHEPKTERVRYAKFVTS